MDFDHSVFSSVRHLVDDVGLYGYYGGVRLLKATVKKFYCHCIHHRIELDERNFTIRYNSNIPHQLGLAGSSAIITACMRALMAFFSIDIPKPILANLVLAVETDELDIAAGLQDRVAQAYQQPVYMDFDRETMENQGYGHYEVLPTELFPSFYIAYKTRLSEGSEIVHSNLRERYNNQAPDVLAALTEWADLTDQVRNCLETGKTGSLAALLNHNFDVRKSVCAVSKENIQMVATARSVGASAKFTGILGWNTREGAEPDMHHDISADLPDVIDLATKADIPRVVGIHGTSGLEHITALLRKGYNGTGFNGQVLRPDELTTIDLSE